MQVPRSVSAELVQEAVDRLGAMVSDAAPQVLSCAIHGGKAERHRQRAIAALLPDGLCKRLVSISNVML